MSTEVLHGHKKLKSVQFEQRLKRLKIVHIAAQVTFSIVYIVLGFVAVVVVSQLYPTMQRQTMWTSMILLTIAAIAGHISIHRWFEHRSASLKAQIIKLSKRSRA